MTDINAINLIRLKSRYNKCRHVNLLALTGCASSLFHDIILNRQSPFNPLSPKGLIEITYFLVPTMVLSIFNYLPVKALRMLSRAIGLFFCLATVIASANMAYQAWHSNAPQNLWIGAVLYATFSLLAIPTIHCFRLETDIAFLQSLEPLHPSPNELDSFDLSKWDEASNR